MMKNTRLLFASLFLLLPLLDSCQKSASKEAPRAVDSVGLGVAPVNTAPVSAEPVDAKPAVAAALGLQGDFDGDGKMENASLAAPKIREEQDAECQGECDCSVQFSGNLKPLAIKTCIGGVLVNEGDLDGKPGDEISIVPDWFTSCWQRMEVFTYRKGQWIKLVSPVTVYACNENDTTDRIRPEKPGFVQVVTDEMNEQGDMKQVTKVVKIN